MGVTYFFIHTLHSLGPFKGNCWENWIFCLKMCHFQDGNDRDCEPELFVRTFQSAVPDQSWSLTSAISVNSCPSVASRLFRTIVAPPCKNITDEAALPATGPGCKAWNLRHYLIVQTMYQDKTRNWTLGISWISFKNNLPLIKEYIHNKIYSISVFFMSRNKLINNWIFTCGHIWD